MNLPSKFCIRVHTAEQFKNVQLRLFELGIEWGNGGKTFYDYWNSERLSYMIFIIESSQRMHRTSDDSYISWLGGYPFIRPNQLFD